MRLSARAAALAAYLPLIFAASDTNASDWTTSPDGTMRSRTFVLNKAVSPSLPEAIVKRDTEMVITDAVAPYLHVFCTDTLQAYSIPLGKSEMSAVGALRGRDGRGRWFVEMAVAWSIIAPPKASVAKTTIARLYDDTNTITQIGTMPSKIEFSNSYIYLNSTHRLVSDSLTGTVWLLHRMESECEAIPLIQHPLLLTPTPKGTALGADGLRIRFVPSYTKPHAHYARNAHSRANIQARSSYNLEVYIGNEARGLILLFAFSYPDLKPVGDGTPKLVYQPRAAGDQVDDFELLSLAHSKHAPSRAGKEVVWATTGTGGGVELRSLVDNKVDQNSGNETLVGNMGTTLAKWQAPEKGAVTASMYAVGKGCRVWVGYTTKGFKLGKVAEVEVLSPSVKGHLGC